MSFVTGLLLIDAPASALNNLGSIPGARTDNTVGVKVIKAKDGSRIPTSRPRPFATGYAPRWRVLDWVGSRHRSTARKKSPTPMPILSSSGMTTCSATCGRPQKRRPQWKSAAQTPRVPVKPPRPTQ